MVRVQSEKRVHKRLYAWWVIRVYHHAHGGPQWGESCASWPHSVSAEASPVSATSWQPSSLLTLSLLSASAGQNNPSFRLGSICWVLNAIWNTLRALVPGSQGTIQDRRRQSSGVGVQCLLGFYLQAYLLPPEPFSPPTPCDCGSSFAPESHSSPGSQCLECSTVLC